MPGVTGQSLSPPLPPPGRERRWLIAVAGLFILSIVAIFANAALRRPEEPRGATAPPPLAALPARAAAAPVLGQPQVPAPEARARNAAIPFLTEPLAPASSFRFAGSTLDRTRATECLALAALAEAGGDDAGQRAVMQVVLNRVRHPAFAGTVCGVVFEGSSRATGCQFTFTCDGSLARRYSEAAWAAARQRAAEALGGRVFAAVGNATHYHTDWVHPWWSPKLVKLAQVDTHLFFRWPGYWGSPAAARVAYRGGEPDPLAAATAQAAAPTAAPLVQSSEAAAATKLLPAGSQAKVAVRYGAGRANFLLLDASAGSAAALAQARKLCGGEGTCRVYGWTDAGAIPKALPLAGEARRLLQFSYARDPSGAEIALYGCDTFRGLPREKCIPRSLR
jgi:hypothetical protein